MGPWPQERPRTTLRPSRPSGAGHGTRHAPTAPTTELTTDFVLLERPVLFALCMSALAATIALAAHGGWLAGFAGLVAIIVGPGILWAHLLGYRGDARYPVAVATAVTSATIWGVLSWMGRSAAHLPASPVLWLLGLLLATVAVAAGERWLTRRQLPNPPSVIEIGRRSAADAAAWPDRLRRLDDRVAVASAIKAHVGITPPPCGGGGAPTSPTRGLAALREARQSARRSGEPRHGERQASSLEWLNRAYEW